MLIELLDAEFSVFGNPVLWREVVGNGFGLLSAIGGMRRVVWAWPVGIIGNALLFTVFLGGVFHTPQALDLYGQAGRQLMFIAVSVYGLVRWMRDSKQTGSAVLPRWGTTRERTAMVVVAIVGTVVFAQLFGYLGSFGKWADAWIFTGSMLATFGMARGLTEFWLIWIAVDVVGVPLLIIAGFYPSAALYLVYAAFVAWGFAVWLRIQNKYIGQKMAS
ncbi:nicotinamide riboside transporter PnuC [Rhodococcus sp. ARC_M12]|uniref:Nicotinamide riboside transporter PnuC n=1 Tax=Rhodococcus navarretei TaxID=3128981 RepID=A0ABU9D137_9NOCA|nr:nicotinamide riboside transporter PnuC [Rhodococcus sp. ARC_M12]MCJ0979543.1 nicotinamide riboside transporter PnuC [Rhodococcus sp. ARC_M12]